MSNNQRSSHLLAIRFSLAAIMVGVFFGLTNVGTGAQKRSVANTDRTGIKQSLEIVHSPNVVSTTITISQVDGGGGGSTGTYLFDYVELKNISSTTQSLNGLTLMYGSAVGQFASSASNAFALPNVTLNPGQYYLVQCGPTGTVGAALPTPDSITPNLTMSASSGKVALATAAFPINTCGATATPCSAAQLANLVDWVAYGAAGNGTAGAGEGGTATNNGVALTSTQGSVRNGSGCTDTDNNNVDFAIVSNPVPRNTSTTAAPCSTTAAGVSVSGRVMTADGRGITNVRVVVTGNSLPQPLVAITGRRGFYNFEDLQAGETYVITVGSRRFSFTAPSRVLSLTDNVSDVDFVAEQ